MKISCDVIKDLLPLYVDDVLSKDSNDLVREHIAECESCRYELDRLAMDDSTILKKNDISANDSENQSLYDSLVKIKKRMSMRQQLTVLVTTVVVAAALAGAWYIYAVRAMYIPYNEAKFTWENDALYIDDAYKISEQLISADGKTMLIKLSKTYRNERETISGPWPVWEKPRVSGDAEAHIEKIYYMSEEASRLYDKNQKLQFGIPSNKKDLKAWNKDFDKIKMRSKLIWTLDGGLTKSDNQN